LHPSSWPRSAEVFSTEAKNEEPEQDETQQPSPAALFSEVCVGSDAGLGSTLAPAGDGACS
jgi:hypothetical protein